MSDPSNDNQLERGAPSAGGEELQAQLLAWMDQERRADKLELVRLGNEIEQAVVRQHEASARLATIEIDIKDLRNRLLNLARLESMVTQMRDALQGMQQWQEQQQKRNEQRARAESLASERERQTEEELRRELTAAQTTLENMRGRLLLLVEEGKRERSQIPEIVGRLDEQKERHDQLNGALSLLNETVRHKSLAADNAEKRLEKLELEHHRSAEWQRLADVKWTRQLSDWQVNIEEWRRQSGEAMIELQALARSVPQMRDEFAELRRQLVDERDRGNQNASAIGELITHREADLDAVNELSGRMGSVIARLDALSGQVGPLYEQSNRAASEQQAFEARLRTERERYEALSLRISELQIVNEQADQRFEALERETAAQLRALAAQNRETAASVAELARRHETSLRDMQREEQAKKQRELASLEQQIREMQERNRQNES